MPEDGLGALEAERMCFAGTLSPALTPPAPHNQVRETRSQKL